MIKLPNHPDYSKNNARVTGENYPCVVCGKEVKKGSRHYSVTLGEGGSHLLMPEEADPSDSGFMGQYPLGVSCYRNYPELRPYSTLVKKGI